MITINARNVNSALLQGVALIRERGLAEASRAGPVLRVPEPVTTVYVRPTERVLFVPWRDANPFFHLVEAAWMLAGRDDLGALTPFVKRMADFSDDGGKTQPGAYGRRWRNWFNRPFTVDQLDWVVKRLKANPSDRRAVIAMWDANHDIDRTEVGSADVPCNLTALPWVSEGALHLTVFCRSNDMILGAYGANAVHFSVLLEYLAGRLGLPVGTYTQISNNFHAYLAELEMVPVDLDPAWRDPYVTTNWTDPRALSTSTYPLFGGDFEDVDWPSLADFEREAVIGDELRRLFDNEPLFEDDVTWPWLRRVVFPMVDAHRLWKQGEKQLAYAHLSKVESLDWRQAAIEWFWKRTPQGFDFLKGKT